MHLRIIIELMWYLHQDAFMNLIVLKSFVIIAPVISTDYLAAL